MAGFYSSHSNGWNSNSPQSVAHDLLVHQQNLGNEGSRPINPPSPGEAFFMGVQKPHSVRSHPFL